jgi:hypothetical protein
MIQKLMALERVVVACGIPYVQDEEYANESFFSTFSFLLDFQSTMMVDRIQQSQSLDNNKIQGITELALRPSEL